MPALHLFLATACLVAGTPEVLAPVVARVNGEVITREEVQAVLTDRAAEIAGVYTGADLRVRMGEEYSRVLGELIEQRLLVQAARREMQPEDRERIERRFDTFMEKNPDQVDTVLRRVRRTPSGSRMTAEEKKELLSLLFVEEAVRRRTRVDALRLSPKALHEYYTGHPAEFTVPETAALQILYVDKEFHGGAEKARAILAQVQKGLDASVDFGALARAYSSGPNADQGGVWKDVRRGMLKPEVEAAAFALKPGGLSGWVETPDGFFLVKRLSHAAARQVPFPEAQEQIRKKLEREEIMKTLTLWVQDLRKSARIEILAEKPGP